MSTLPYGSRVCPPGATRAHRLVREVGGSPSSRCGILTDSFVEAGAEIADCPLCWEEIVAVLPRMTVDVRIPVVVCDDGAWWSPSSSLHTDPILSAQVIEERGGKVYWLKVTLPMPSAVLIEGDIKVEGDHGD